MFLKPITIKSNSRIKASERKQLLEEFQRQYPMVLPLPVALASSSVLRLKIATSDSTYVNIFKFDNQPLLIEYQKTLIPSLFLLWLLPDLLPHFKTHDDLIPKLASGADLMIPGIVLDQPLSPSSFDSIQKGVLCAVSTTSSRAPIAVGHTAMSSYDMFMSGGRGKAVIIYHVLGDSICALGTGVSRPLLSWTVSTAPTTDDRSVENCRGDFGMFSSTQPVASQQEETRLCQLLADTKMKDFTDVNALLRDCFLRGLNQIKDNQLPMPVNVFYAQYVLTQKPESVDLDIKKTSYKKVGVFLSAMQNERLIELSEPKPGIFVLKSVLRDNLALLGMSPSPESDQPSVFKSSPSKIWPPGYFGPPHIEDVRIVTGPASALFSQAGYGPNTCISQSEARRLIDSYIHQRGIQRQDDPSLVLLDSLLMKVCDPKFYIEAPESSLSKPVYLIPLQKLHSLALQSLPVVYRISPAEGRGAPILWRKNEAPYIQISTVTKNGRKLTRIANLPLFTIDSDAFAKQLQLMLACSAGRVDEPQYAKMDVIQAQGSHEVAVSKILTETYAIPKRYIKGYVESKPPKKKK
ncbi:hypothetical protein P879_01992 [Paragonimus westermani]|uniref:SUI1 domain-containing protein n=1 Tax=Paragonimus westermani TaxID=34504 RepID=A0A8T0DS74_9TREM|nr:hypothetical protein P879_01992 [Paragonimus westermani]